MRADNSGYLIAAAKRRSDDAVERVRQTLRELRRTGQPATIAGVARRAGVSRTFLHSQPELLEALRALKPKNDGPDPIPARQRATERSLHTRIEALTTVNKTLRRDNSELKRRLELALGDLRQMQLRLPPPEPSS